MAATVTHHSFEKKKKKREMNKESRLFCSGGAQPENSILRQQRRGKYLSKDQRWQSQTHYKTMADGPDACRRLPRCYLSRGRKGDASHRLRAPHHANPACRRTPDPLRRARCRSGDDKEDKDGEMSRCSSPTDAVAFKPAFSRRGENW